MARERGTSDPHIMLEKRRISVLDGQNTRLFLKSLLTFPLFKADYYQTRMTTSIRSKAFCSITDRQTDKIFNEQMLIYEGNLHKKKLERYLL